MITSDNCSASVFVNSWFFLITLITTGKNECCFFFLFSSIWSVPGVVSAFDNCCASWWDYRYNDDWWHFTKEKRSLLGNKWTWLCELLGKSSVQSGGGVLIQSLSKEGARPQKRFFSALRASIWPKNTEGWSGSLLGGVSWNKGAIVKENMFYLGELGRIFPVQLLNSWHEHVDTEKKLKKIHGPRILWQNRREITYATQ